MSTPTSAGARFVERATELRMIIAILFAVYGVVCLILSPFVTAQELQKAAGINVNLWTGLGMLVIAILFYVWAVVKPLGVEKSADTERVMGGDDPS